jgi:hypothetical protein
MDYTLTEIETIVRQLLGDFSKTLIPGDIFTYGTSSVFTLSESNPIAITKILVGDVEIGDSEYSFDNDTKVTINKSMNSGDSVEIQYTYYPNYSSEEIQNYIKAAIVHISACNYTTFIVENSTIYPEPSREEENLIAIISSILIEPDNKSYSLPDITIRMPSDLPTNQKIRQTISSFKKNSHGTFFVG